jgi:hypothetical protein
MGRKRAKKHLKNNRRDEGSYKNAIQQLLTEEEENEVEEFEVARGQNNQ